MRIEGIALVAASILVLNATAVRARAQGTWRVSVSSAGAAGNDTSHRPSISANGRFVSFASTATNLVTGDTNARRDVFVHDRATGATTRVSVDSSGAQANHDSNNPEISADGRFVAFNSNASNLVPGDTNSIGDVFVHDRDTGATTRVSVSSSGVQGGSQSSLASISADGRFVSFYGVASNLVPGDTNSVADVFVHDRQTGSTTRVSVDSTGAQGNGHSEGSSISADGRYVVFESAANNLVVGDTNLVKDAFVHDRQTASTSRVSVDSSGAQGNAQSRVPRISADGSTVAFYSDATNLVAGDVNLRTDVYVHELQGGATLRVSLGPGGAESNGHSYAAAISQDGTRLAFVSDATNLVGGDSNGDLDVFVHDRTSGTTSRASVNSAGGQGTNRSEDPEISADGRQVAFHSLASNLVPGDANGVQDVFVHGTYLTLEVRPSAVTVGDSMTLRAWNGQPFDKVTVVVASLGGPPWPLPRLLGGELDANGRVELDVLAPPGSVGAVLAFRACGSSETGRLLLSNQAVVSVQ